MAAGQLTTFRFDFVLIQVDQVDYSQFTHGDGVSVTVRLLSNLH